MAIINKNIIINLIVAKKITVIGLIMASFMLAIAGSSDLQFADAQKSGDEPDLEFIRQFGTSEVDQAVDVSADSSGNVYVVGGTDGAFPGQTNEGESDAFIRKYNSDGDEQWTRQFGTSDSDSASGVSVDSSGNVYVVGFTSGELPGQTSEGGVGDAFIRKYNSDGDEQWTRQFGTSSQDAASGVSVDSSGNVYVVGGTDGELPGQTSEGGVGDAFIRKYNSDGDEQWTRQFGTDGEDTAFGVSVDSSGGVYVVGLTRAAFPGQTNEGGESDAFIRKYNSDGDEQWTRQFGTDGDDFARDVFADSSGNVYVVGSFGGAEDEDEVIIGGDAFIRKYNSDGDEQWTRQFGTSEGDAANGVSADSSGGVYVVGETGGEFPGQTNEGGIDAFLAKFAIDHDDNKKKHGDDNNKKNHHDDNAKKKH
jgi:hypothetical protein